MRKHIDKHTKKLIAGVAVFAVAAILVQGVAAVFMTAGGLKRIYPYYLSLRSEEIDVTDSSLGEYFSLHGDVEDADVVVLGVDMNVADSYRLASDYLQFVRKLSHVSDVAFYVPRAKLSVISEAMAAGDYGKYSDACEVQLKLGGISDQMLKFIEKLYNTNAKLPANKKINLSGFKGIEDLDDVQNAVMSDLLSTPSGLAGEHISILSAKTNEEYVALFDKYADDLSVFLGSRFEFHVAYRNMAAQNTIRESSAVSNMTKYAPPGGGTVFVVVPDELCSDNSPFLEELREIYGKVSVTKTVYFDCKTVAQNEEVVRNDGVYPDFSNGMRVVSKKDFSKFKKHFDKVTGGKSDFIGDTGKFTYFIVSGSGAVTFNDDEKNKSEKPGTVIVAPGA